MARRVGTSMAVLLGRTRSLGCFTRVATHGYSSEPSSPESSSPETKDEGTAGKGAPPGETISTDRLQNWWCLDLTFGRKKEAYEDCRLGEDIKDEMYLRHTKENWTVERLAEYYRIRQQRVMAIITLREMREEDAKNGFELDYGFENYANKETGTNKRRGSGEAHVKAMPSQPRYVFLSEEEKNDYVDIETRLLQDSALEEEKLVAEFKERLEFNTFKRGKDLERRVSRHKTAPRRPKEGWTFVVKPLDANGAEPFAVEPSGKRRDLTESEQVFQDRQKGRPRPKIPKF